MSTEQNKTLTLGSLFAGSGGFELGGLLAGIQPVWNCEVEPFPIRVTTKRLPQVIHYGDISSLRGAELPPVDIITGGFPCQSVSVAGKERAFSISTTAEKRQPEVVCFMRRSGLLKK